MNGVVVMYEFGNGLIKCLNCNSTYRGKMQRNKKVYLCTNYAKNGSQACERYVINEDDLIYTCTKHLALMGKRVEGSLGEHIEVIEVLNKGYTIYYKDGSKSVINDDPNHIGVKVQY